MTTGTPRNLLAATAITAATIGVGLAFPLGLAAASDSADSPAGKAGIVGTQAGKTAGEIKATLTGHGYEVRKVETEDGELEAYAVRDGKRFEIYVDPATGAVSKVEEED